MVSGSSHLLCLVFVELPLYFCSPTWKPAPLMIKMEVFQWKFCIGFSDRNRTCFLHFLFKNYSHQINFLTYSNHMYRLAKQNEKCFNAAWIETLSLKSWFSDNKLSVLSVGGINLCLTVQQQAIRGSNNLWKPFCWDLITVNWSVKSGSTGKDLDCPWTVSTDDSRAVCSQAAQAASSII